jgi:uncharacterized OB-fold protein
MERPLPIEDSDTKEFWDAAKNHVLVAQKCLDCSKLCFPPLPTCPHCASTNRGWQELSGKATVWSWIVVHSTPHPYWRERTPYVVAHVELADQPGLRMIGNLVDVPQNEIRGGMGLEVTFLDVDGASLPLWRARSD